MQSCNTAYKLDQAMGRTFDANSERMTANLTELTKQHGMRRIDSLVISKAETGENAIVVQGRLDDPSHHRAHMKIRFAIETSVAESFDKIE